MYWCLLYMIIKFYWFVIKNVLINKFLLVCGIKTLFKRFCLKNVSISDKVLKQWKERKMPPLNVVNYLLFLTELLVCPKNIVVEAFLKILLLRVLTKLMSTNSCLSVVSKHYSNDSVSNFLTDIVDEYLRWSPSWKAEKCHYIMLFT